MARARRLQAAVLRLLLSSVSGSLSLFGLLSLSFLRFFSFSFTFSLVPVFPSLSLVPTLSSPPFSCLSLSIPLGVSFFFSSPVLLFSPLFIEPWRGFDVEPRSGSRSVCRGAAGLPRLRPRGGLSAIVSVGGPPAWGLCRLVRGTCKKNKKIQSFLLPRCNVRGEEDSEQCRSKRHRSVPFFFFLLCPVFLFLFIENKTEQVRLSCVPSITQRLVGHWGEFGGGGGEERERERGGAFFQKFRLLFC